MAILATLQSHAPLVNPFPFLYVLFAVRLKSHQHALESSHYLLCRSCHFLDETKHIDLSVHQTILTTPLLLLAQPRRCVQNSRSEGAERRTSGGLGGRMCTRSLPLHKRRGNPAPQSLLSLTLDAPSCGPPAWLSLAAALASFRTGLACPACSALYVACTHVSASTLSHARN